MTTVLVADDEESLRTLIEATLDGSEFHTVPAANGAEALRLARQGKFDVILLDWMMPGMNGIEVLKALRGQPETALIPVIMLTARGQTNDQERAATLGAAAYLMKPFSPLALLETIQSTLKAARASAPRAEAARRTTSTALQTP